MSPLQNQRTLNILRHWLGGGKHRYELKGNIKRKKKGKKETTKGEKQHGDQPPISLKR